MEKTKSELPPGLFPGVMPPDGTQLTVEIWLMIFDLLPEDRDAFVKQLWRDKVPHPKYCGTMMIDSTHIRRVIRDGRAAE